MRISDWSSDVCSSYLAEQAEHLVHEPVVIVVAAVHRPGALAGLPRLVLGRGEGPQLGEDVLAAAALVGQCSVDGEPVRVGVQRAHGRGPYPGSRDPCAQYRRMAPTAPFGLFGPCSGTIITVAPPASADWMAASVSRASSTSSKPRSVMAAASLATCIGSSAATCTRSSESPETSSVSPAPWRRAARTSSTSSRSEEHTYELQALLRHPTA